MTFALHRVSKEYIANVDSSDYPVADWIIDPDVGVLIKARVPAKHWLISGDVVTEMSANEKLVIDRDELILQQAFELEQEKSKFNDKVLVAFADVIKDEINALRAVAGLNARTFEQLRSAIRKRIDQL